MTKGRVEAFSDGVIAIIITIMVLELHPPEGTALSDLAPVLPKILGYVLSFAYVGIYWNNHHHLMQLVRHVRGGVLWANMHLLFWLSVIPFTTAWMSEHHAAPVPTALYGGNLIMCGIAYTILVRALISVNPPETGLAEAIGNDWKGWVSVGGYALAIPLAFFNRWISVAIYVSIALLWFVPDTRIERVLHKQHQLELK
ncbi:MAG: TMEM175 family protein [Gemmatimonas sp.]